LRLAAAGPGAAGLLQGEQAREIEEAAEQGQGSHLERLAPRHAVAAEPRAPEHGDHRTSPSATGYSLRADRRQGFLGSIVRLPASPMEGAGAVSSSRISGGLSRSFAMTRALLTGASVSVSSRPRYG